MRKSKFALQTYFRQFLLNAVLVFTIFSTDFRRIKREIERFQSSIEYTAFFLNTSGRIRIFDLFENGFRIFHSTRILTLTKRLNRIISVLHMLNNCHNMFLLYLFNSYLKE